MHADWVRYLLLVYGALALSMLLSLYLWASSKIEWRSQARRDHGARQELADGLAAARAELEEMRAGMGALEHSLREIQQTSGALVAPTPPRSGLNLSTRSQVLRRNRFGEPAEGIATSLGVPRAEVNLLLKVNRIVVENL